MRTGSKQILLVTCAAAITAALYFAPNKTVLVPAKPGEDSFSLESVSTEAKGQLKRQEADRITQVEQALRLDPASVELHDSLGRIWDSYKKPDISARYFEKVALLQPSEKNWINTAFRYYDSFRMAQDSAQRAWYVNKAIESYEKVLEINPANLNAKTDMGLCYAEGTGDPMKGITLLREVVQQDSLHEMAQFNLGVLSVKSGQYDRAVSRFEKVLSINPRNVEATYLLGRTYLQMGNKEMALENLSKINKTGDVAFNNEVNSLIQNIKNN